MKNADLFEKVAAEIIAAIESGQLKSWEKPFKSGFARNFFNGTQYRGINWLLLNYVSKKVPLYGTYNQINAAGGRVKDGEKHTKVFFQSKLVYHNGKQVKDVKKIAELEAKGEKLDSFFFWKEYQVFSLEQTTGIDYENTLNPEGVEPLEATKLFLDGYKDKPEIIRHNIGRAYYKPSEDKIYLPQSYLFSSPEEELSTIAHECAHSTGHSTRLNRKAIVEFDKFGSEQYSFEELEAELAAVYVCGLYGLTYKTLNNSAAYLRHWVGVLKKEPKILFSAAAEAQKIFDYMTR